MKKIAKFYKVSYSQFKKDWLKIVGSIDENELNRIYERIILPKRATSGSAGYDFFSPISFTLKSGEIMTMPTGVRVEIAEGWVLKCYPRSGLGFNFRLQLNNTVGIIDADYFNSDNEGHIITRIINDSRDDKMLAITDGKGYIQGVFVEFGITFDDEVNSSRNGGFGSTSV